MLGGATGIGFAPVLVRLSEVGPSATAFYRLFFALPLLWLWLRSEARHRPGLRQPRCAREFGLLALAGLLFTGDLAIWHWSLQFTSVANSTLLANFAPLFVTLGAWLFFSETITAVFLVAMTLALGGASLLVWDTLEFKAGHLLGDTLALAAAVFYAGYLLCVKRLRRSFSTAAIMAWSGLVSCAGFWLVGVASQERLLPMHERNWAVLVALALVSHVGGQTLIAYALGHLPASFSAVNLLLQPVVAAAVAWVVLSEPLSELQAMGGVVVLAGIALAGRANQTDDARSGPDAAR